MRWPWSEEALAITVEGRQDIAARRTSSPILRIEMKEARGVGEILAKRRKMVNKMERKAVAKRKVVWCGGILGGKCGERQRRARIPVRITMREVSGLEESD